MTLNGYFNIQHAAAGETAARRSSFVDASAIRAAFRVSPTHNIDLVGAAADWFAAILEWADGFHRCSVMKASVRGRRVS